MSFDELLEFIKYEDGRILKNFQDGFTEKEVVLSRMVKVNEEVGELNNDVLKYFGGRSGKKEISYEMADVIVTVIMLAERLGIDIQEALKEKIEIVKNRKYE